MRLDHARARLEKILWLYLRKLLFVYNQLAKFGGHTHCGKFIKVSFTLWVEPLENNNEHLKKFYSAWNSRLWHRSSTIEQKIEVLLRKKNDILQKTLAKKAQFQFISEVYSFRSKTIRLNWNISYWILQKDLT